MNSTPIETFSPGRPGGLPPQPALDQAVDRALSCLSPLPPAGLTVLVNDPQRHTDSLAVLRLLCERLGSPPLRVLVACGSHRFDQAARQCFEASLREAAPLVTVRWHDARADDLVAVGSRGWRGHPWLLDAPALLAVGSVEPHYFAGFTGAHKTATIGCAAYSEIESNHAHALSSDCRPCRLDGNPIHEGVRSMIRSLEALRPVGAVNLVQAGPRVLAAAGGRPLDALRELEPFCRECFTRRIDRHVDAVIVQADGPLGRSFYQADKAIKNNEWAVRDGGVMVLEAPCQDGIGQDAFVRLLREAPTWRQAADLVARQGYRLGDHKSVRLRYLTDPACRGVRAFVVSKGLAQADAAVLGLTKAESAEQALEQGGIDPARDRVLRVQDAGNLCLVVGC
ncbi:MAG: hypothetical protein BWX88_02946 [Planctomycetes bacterium ADurb.Bin126]|nr:MAG: hypothetical protein BWX88_02946 [Planctomycetes bacterium ADurb.Bin126]HOD80606.1 lactate racemase domain-containing protein [Phycisphaerae bacterium]HQL74081.1 lactate racemase domain-containing protein [Phycisphaerae bacterium]